MLQPNIKYYTTHQGIGPEHLPVTYQAMTNDKANTPKRLDYRSSEDEEDDDTSPKQRQLDDDKAANNDEQCSIEVLPRIEGDHCRHCFASVCVCVKCLFIWGVAGRGSA